MQANPQKEFVFLNLVLATSYNIGTKTQAH